MHRSFACFRRPHRTKDCAQDDTLVAPGSFRTDPIPLFLAIVIRDGFQWKRDYRGWESRRIRANP